MHGRVLVLSAALALTAAGWALPAKASAGSPPRGSPQGSAIAVALDAPPFNQPRLAQLDPGRHDPDVGENGGGNAPIEGTQGEDLGKVPLPRSCEGARDHAQEMRERLAPSIPQETRTAARDYAAKPAAGSSSAKAWNEFAIAASLLGDVPGAAWAGLQAIDLEWRPEWITNAGVHLIAIGEYRTARALLTCAQDMDYRSPYLFEALAAIDHAQGDVEQAQRRIRRARTLAPNDPMIATEASLLTTGEPPDSLPTPDVPPANIKVGEDDSYLDQLLAELRDHLERVKTELRARWQRLARLHPGYADIAHLNDALESKEDHIETFVEAKIKESRHPEEWIERYDEWAEEHGETTSDQWSKPELDRRVRRFKQVTRFEALVNGINTYFFVTSTRLTMEFSPEVHLQRLLFWADVLGMDPAQLEREMRHHIPEKSNKVKVHEPPERGAPPPYHHKAYVMYRAAKFQATSEWVETRSACRDQWSGATQRACERSARREYCRSSISAYEEWVGRRRERLTMARTNFPKVARQYMSWTHRELERARRFANRWLPLLEDPAVFPNREFFPYDGVKAVQRRWQGGEAPEALVDQHLEVDGDPTGVANNLHEAGKTLSDAARHLEEWMSIERSDIQEDCASVGEHAPTDDEWLRLLLVDLDELTEEQLQELLDKVASETQDDVRAEAEFAPHCEASIGPASFTVDHTGEVTRSVQGVGLSTRGKDVTGASIGIGAKGGEILVGKGDLSLIASFDERGEWKAVAEASGSVGAGLEVPGVGGGSCYPGSGSVTFHARAFLQKEVVYQRIRRELETRRGD